MNKVGGFLVRIFDGNKWYWCKCENCGWEDSSEFCLGGDAIADTGDYSDPICPVCLGSNLEGEPTLDVPDDGDTHEIEIPLRTILEPYKKLVRQFQDIEDKKHWDEMGKMADEHENHKSIEQTLVSVCEENEDLTSPAYYYLRDDAGGTNEYIRTDLVYKAMKAAQKLK